MKLLIVCIIVTVGYVSCRPEEKYTIKYDNVDLDEILNSDRLTKNYVDCLMDRKPCPPDGNELKRVIPDALQSGCGKCSDKQKEGAKKVIHHLYKNKKDWWVDLQKKYDPENTYATKYADELGKL